MTVLGYYFTMAALSAVCSAVYFIKWHKHFDVNFTIMYLLFPIVSVGYLLLAISRDVGTAITANKIVYLGGCYLTLFVTLEIFSLCKIRVPKWVSFSFVIMSTVAYVGVLSVGYRDWFYTDTYIREADNVTILEKSYGPLHTWFYIILIIYLLVDFIAPIYAHFKKAEASRVNIALILISEAITVVAFFGGRAISDEIEWMSVAYVMDALVFLLIVDRVALYDVENTVIDSVLRSGVDGYISLDLDYNFLGSNDSARQIIPELQRLKVDRSLKKSDLGQLIMDWVEDFRVDNITRDQFYERDGKIYKILVGHLYDARHVRGYQITIKDDTSHQNYLKSITEYNKNLRKEITAKNKMLLKG